MTLTLNENSYATVATADVYFETRLGTSAWDEASTSDKEAALVQATQEIDNNSYVGYATVATQDLAWPRKEATYNDPRSGLVVTPEEDEVPDRVVKAVYEQALHILTNPEAIQSNGSAGTFESISVGPISISDSTSTSASQMPRTSKFSLSLIKPLFVVGMGTSTWWRNN